MVSPLWFWMVLVRNSKGSWRSRPAAWLWRPTTRYYWCAVPWRSGFLRLALLPAPVLRLAPTAIFRAAIMHGTLRLRADPLYAGLYNGPRNGFSTARTLNPPGN